MLLFNTILLSLFVACQPAAPAPAGPGQSPGAPQDKHWAFETRPVWSDEFDYTGKPAPNKWGYDTGGGGWGNNELQYYTDALSNARVAEGKLMITARKEKKDNRDYTSARLVTKNKGDWTYGRWAA